MFKGKEVSKCVHYGGLSRSECDPLPVETWDVSYVNERGSGGQKGFVKCTGHTFLLLRVFAACRCCHACGCVCVPCVFA